MAPNVVKPITSGDTFKVNRNERLTRLVMTIRKIRGMMVPHPTRHGKSRSDKRIIAARKKITKLVNEFNALTMPFTVLGVDVNGTMILTTFAMNVPTHAQTLFNREKVYDLFKVSVGVFFGVDKCVVMHPDGTLTVVKDRHSDETPDLTLASREMHCDLEINK